MARFVHVLFLMLLCRTCFGNRDPFDMFSGASQHEDRLIALPSVDPVTAQHQPFSSVSDKVSTLEHYRELHRVLTRILWHSLRLAENQSMNAGDRIRIQLTASLDSEDIHTLSAYCHLNRTIAEHVSAESVNALFSRLFESVVIVSNTAPDDFWSPQMQHLLLCVGLCTLVLTAYWIGVRRILLITVPCLFISAVVIQALYRKYNERVAEKMAHMSRYHEPPEQCKPAHLQSWRTWLLGWIHTRPAHDECARYYEQVLTDPWISTSLYEIFLELVFEPLVTLSRLSGRAFGQFYHQLTVYFPSLFAIPVTMLMFTLFCLIVVWLIRSPLSTATRLTKTRRHVKHQQLKTKPLPSLPEPKK